MDRMPSSRTIRTSTFPQNVVELDVGLCAFCSCWRTLTRSIGFVNVDANMLLNPARPIFCASSVAGEATGSNGVLPRAGEADGAALMDLENCYCLAAAAAPARQTYLRAGACGGASDLCAKDAGEIKRGSRGPVGFLHFPRDAADETRRGAWTGNKCTDGWQQQMEKISNESTSGPYLPLEAFLVLLLAPLGPCLALVDLLSDLGVPVATFSSTAACPSPAMEDLPLTSSRRSSLSAVGCRGIKPCMRAGESCGVAGPKVLAEKPDVVDDDRSIGDDQVRLSMSSSSCSSDAVEARDSLGEGPSAGVRKSDSETSSSGNPPSLWRWRSDAASLSSVIVAGGETSKCWGVT